MLVDAKLQDDKSLAFARKILAELEMLRDEVAALRAELRRLIEIDRAVRTERAGAPSH
jgi:hypothetical protein